MTTTRSNLWILADDSQVVCEQHLYLYGIRDGADSRGRRPIPVTPKVTRYFMDQSGQAPKCERCAFESRQSPVAP